LGRFCYVRLVSHRCTIRSLMHQTLIHQSLPSENRPACTTLFDTLRRKTLTKHHQQPRRSLDTNSPREQCPQ
jgi:hypothetical protein